MNARNKPLVILWAIAVFFVAALHPNPVRAKSSDIEASMARLRRLLHIPGASPARSYTQTIPFASIIRRAARTHGIDPSLLAALVRVESNFDPWAVSRAGAQGLGQLMPSTGRELGVVDPFDPHQNLAASSRYLADQLRAFQSTPLALAAYNAGPARVRQGTVPASTWRYVGRIERIAKAYRTRGMP